MLAPLDQSLWQLILLFSSLGNGGKNQEKDECFMLHEDSASLYPVSEFGTQAWPVLGMMCPCAWIKHSWAVTVQTRRPTEASWKSRLLRGSYESQCEGHMEFNQQQIYILEKWCAPLSGWKTNQKSKLKNFKERPSSMGNKIQDWLQATCGFMDFSIEHWVFSLEQKRGIH